MFVLIGKNGEIDLSRSFHPDTPAGIIRQGQSSKAGSIACTLGAYIGFDHTAHTVGIQSEESTLPTIHIGCLTQYAPYPLHLPAYGYALHRFRPL